MRLCFLASSGNAVAGVRAGGVDAHVSFASRNWPRRARRRAYKVQRVPRTDLDDATDADEDAEHGCAMSDLRVVPSHRAGDDGDATEGARRRGAANQPTPRGVGRILVAVSSPPPPSTSTSCDGAAGGGFMRWGGGRAVTRIFSMEDLDDDGGGHGNLRGMMIRASSQQQHGRVRSQAARARGADRRRLNDTRLGVAPLARARRLMD